jgi:hypothetical protein
MVVLPRYRYGPTQKFAALYQFFEGSVLLDLDIVVLSQIPVEKNIGW